MTRHEQKVKAAEDAITTVFSDTTVSQEHTIDSLRELRRDIEIKMVAIKSDIERKEKGKSK